MILNSKKVTLLALLYLPIHAFEKVHYNFSHEPIDVVIPCHPKDAATLEKVIDGVKKYVLGLRRVMVISAEKITDNAEWVDEKIFPFSKESIAHELFKDPKVIQYQFTKRYSRMGWIFQQLLKLYSAFCIPDISSNILIVDSDVIFLKPIDFLSHDGTELHNGAGLYAVGSEHYQPYFEHAKRLLPGLKKVYPEYSGIVHHMIFQKQVLDDLFNCIHQEHDLEPWLAIIGAISVVNNDIDPSCLSEYEIYFNFVFSRTDQVQLRNLKFVSRVLNDDQRINEAELELYKQEGYDYATFHTWGA